MLGSVRLVRHGIRQQPVQQLREHAQPDAHQGEQHHRRLHVPRRVLGAQSRVLLEEHVPRELDAGVQEHARRRRHQQVPHPRHVHLGGG